MANESFTARISTHRRLETDGVTHTRPNTTLFQERERINTSIKKDEGRKLTNPEILLGKIKQLSSLTILTG
jgi:hypothetical protein